jgi:hypothetical protein
MQRKENSSTTFINRVGRGGNARYLLNGEPGCGKKSIREIARRLIPNVTFIIPDFTNIRFLNLNNGSM